MGNLQWKRTPVAGSSIHQSDDGMWTIAKTGRFWHLTSEPHHVDELLPTLSAAKNRAEEFVILNAVDSEDLVEQRAQTARADLIDAAHSIRDLQESVAEAFARAGEIAATAQALGLLSWSEIGLAMGMTKQGAQKRFGR